MSTPQAQARGFLASLFDFSFSSYVTPKLIRVIYVFVVVVSALAALVFVIGAFATNVLLGLVTLVILAPLLFLFYVVVYRVFLEVVMAVFTIAENTTRLVGGAGGPASPGAFGGLAGGPSPGAGGGFGSPGGGFGSPGGGFGSPGGGFAAARGGSAAGAAPSGTPVAGFGGAGREDAPTAPPATTRRVEPWSAPEPGWPTDDPTAPTVRAIPDEPTGGTPEG